MEPHHSNAANSGDVLLLLVRSGYVPSEEDMNDFDLENAEKGKISLGVNREGKELGHF